MKKITRSCLRCPVAQYKMKIKKNRENFSYSSCTVCISISFTCNERNCKLFFKSFSSAVISGRLSWKLLVVTVQFCFYFIIIILFSLPILDLETVCKNNILKSRKLCLLVLTLIFYGCFDKRHFLKIHPPSPILGCRFTCRE